jgi:hypothetical protein
MANHTALWIIQQACGELGVPAPAHVTGIGDETGQQMLALLNSAGYDLSANFQWEELTKLHKFFTVNAQGEYDLPPDYNNFLDCTAWDNTNRWPLLGPASQQEWNAIIAAKVEAVLRTYYKLQQKKLCLYPVPVDIRELVLSYSSLYWVNSATGIPKQEVDQDDDVPILNDWLLVKFLKLKIWSAKGFDTTSLNADFTTAYLSLTAKSKGSRVLSLAPKIGTILIGPQNIPEGNWVQ